MNGTSQFTPALWGTLCLQFVLCLAGLLTIMIGGIGFAYAVAIGWGIALALSALAGLVGAWTRAGREWGFGVLTGSGISLVFDMLALVAAVAYWLSTGVELS
jgi:hypothetical protein